MPPKVNLPTPDAPEKDESQTAETYNGRPLTQGPVKGPKENFLPAAYKVGEGTIRVDH